MSEVRVAEIRKQRATAVERVGVLAAIEGAFTADQETEFTALETQVKGFDAELTRIERARTMSAATATPVRDQEVVLTTPAAAETDKYVTNKSLVIGAMVKMAGLGGGNLRESRLQASELYGERHPVTRALNASQGSSGGFIIPPDYMNEIIELLRPVAQVRSANPRNIPMPRGTMTLPGQASAAIASYAGETTAIGVSQQTLNQIVASYKKLTALVPVTNDMMRYADPAVDAFVRDDLVKVIALREDLAFMFGDGTANTPRGYTSFANGYATANGGTAGVWNVGANSTAAVGGNFITSNETYTLSTAAQELGGLMNKLDTANVPDIRRMWFFHPRTKNYLYNVQNSLGVYVYRDELNTGKLLGYPFRCSTQVPINIQDPTGTNSDCSFIILAEMDETMILDSMQLELAVSRDGTYVDASGTTWSAFANDQTLIRAIAEHDFQMRHDAAVAVDQFVRWAPAIS